MKQKTPADHWEEHLKAVDAKEFYKEYLELEKGIGPLAADFINNEGNGLHDSLKNNEE